MIRLEDRFSEAMPTTLGQLMARLGTASEALSDRTAAATLHPALADLAGRASGPSRPRLGRLVVRAVTRRQLTAAEQRAMLLPLMGLLEAAAAGQLTLTPTGRLRAAGVRALLAAVDRPAAGSSRDRQPRVRRLLEVGQDLGLVRLPAADGPVDESPAGRNCHAPEQLWPFMVLRLPTETTPEGQRAGMLALLCAAAPRPTEEFRLQSRSLLGMPVREARTAAARTSAVLDLVGWHHPCGSAALAGAALTAE